VTSNSEVGRSLTRDEVDGDVDKEERVDQAVEGKQEEALLPEPKREPVRSTTQVPCVKRGRLVRALIGTQVCMSHPKKSCVTRGRFVRALQSEDSL
jgi:hypothetical protein